MLIRISARCKLTDLKLSTCTQITQNACIYQMSTATQREVLTQPDTAVLQKVAEVVEHGFLVLTADSAKVAQEATAAGHHLGEGNFLVE